MRIQLSHPCNRMEPTKDLNSFNSTGKLMGFLCQMTLSLVMADAAWSSFSVTCFVELPSLVKVKPRYLKLFTSSSFCPFSVMEVAASWVRLFTMTLLFSEFTSIPYAPVVLSNLVVRSWSYASLPPVRSISSAKCRLHSGRPPMEMEVVEALLNYVLQIDVKQNLRGDILLQLRCEKKIPCMLFLRTTLLESSFSALMTSVMLVLKFFMTCSSTLHDRILC